MAAFVVNEKICLLVTTNLMYNIAPENIFSIKATPIKLVGSRIRRLYFVSKWKKKKFCFNTPKNEIARKNRRQHIFMN